MQWIETLPESDTVIPWQVACELAAVVRKMVELGRFRGDSTEAIRALRACFPIELPQLATPERSLRIQERDRVSTWDALLIAACADAGVRRLYSEDLQGKPVIEGVEIVNPFA